MPMTFVYLSVPERSRVVPCTCVYYANERCQRETTRKHRGNPKKMRIDWGLLVPAATNFFQNETSLVKYTAQREIRKKIFELGRCVDYLPRNY